MLNPLQFTGQELEQKKKDGKGYLILTYQTRYKCANKELNYDVNVTKNIEFALDRSKYYNLNLQLHI